MGRRIKQISEVKTLADLNRLKAEKRYTKELKKLELQASFIRLQSQLSPESIKETITIETQNFAQELAVKFLPSILLKLFKK